MKAEHISIASTLEQIPNIGKKTANLLRDVGVTTPLQLCNQDGYFLYDKICQITHCTHGVQLLDILLSAIDFTYGNRPRHWSEFSEQRKRLINSISSKHSRPNIRPNINSKS